MTINFTLLAQNSDVNYINQAYACALSIKITNPNSKICLITNDSLTNKQKEVFDDIVEIPWGDMATNYNWKIQNRWKTYHVTPYEKTFVLDTDMLVLDNLENLWNYLEFYDVYYTTTVSDYRGRNIENDFYRKTFTKHNLPNVYSGLYYFKKTKWSKVFYEYVELVVKNWQMFYEKFVSGTNNQKFLSMDLCAAIVIKLLNCEKQVTSMSNNPRFVHMKSKIQNWSEPVSDNWMTMINSYITEDLELYVGNYKQRGIFHYTVDEFLTEDMIKIYENKLGLK